MIDRSQKVPAWRAGLIAEALADYCQPLFTLLVEARELARCGQVAAALGGDLVPKKIEGVRSKLKRLVDEPGRWRRFRAVRGARSGRQVRTAMRLY